MDPDQQATPGRLRGHQQPSQAGRGRHPSIISYAHIMHVSTWLLPPGGTVPHHLTGNNHSPVTTRPNKKHSQYSANIFNVPPWSPINLQRPTGLLVDHSLQAVTGVYV